MFRNTLFTAVRAAQPVRQYARGSDAHIQLQKDLSVLVGRHRAARMAENAAIEEYKNAKTAGELTGDARKSVEATRDYFAYLSTIFPSEVGNDCAKLSKSADRLLKKKDTIDPKVIDDCVDKVKFFQEVKASLMSQMSRKVAEIVAECADDKPKLGA